MVSIHDMGEGDIEVGVAQCQRANGAKMFHCGDDLPAQLHRNGGRWWGVAGGGGKWWGGGGGGVGRGWGGGAEVVGRWCGRAGEVRCGGRWWEMVGRCGGIEGGCEREGG